VLEITGVAPPPSRIYDPTHSFFLNLFVFTVYPTFVKSGRQTAVACLRLSIKERKKKKKKMLMRADANDHDLTLRSGWASCCTHLTKLIATLHHFIKSYRSVKLVTPYALPALPFKQAAPNPISTPKKRISFLGSDIRYLRGQNKDIKRTIGHMSPFEKF
jgi:hypothetical protein